MTVKELKDILKELPENDEIIFWEREGEYIIGADTILYDPIEYNFFPTYEILFSIDDLREIKL